MSEPESGDVVFTIGIMMVDTTTGAVHSVAKQGAKISRQWKATLLSAMIVTAGRLWSGTQRKGVIFVQP